MNYAEAIAFLDGHINLETGIVNDVAPATGTTAAAGPGDQIVAAGRRLDPPSLDRMRRLAAFLGDPQEDLSLIHVTGTNGKGSTVRMAASLLHALGRSVGTYTSPHLARPNERIASATQPIADEEFAEMVRVLRTAEDAAGQRNSWFELMTAGAFRWFSDLAVESAVIEVGAGGRWDATNIAKGTVAVITNIDLDHQQWFGDTKLDIAREKVGIVKSGATVVIGESDPDIVAYLERQARDLGGERIWVKGVDYACDSNRVALGGRLCTLRTPTASYRDIFVPCHGAHQGENAATALAAVEAFIEDTLPEDIVLAGFGTVDNPGRMEIVGRDPLTLLDGAHNPAGARAAAATLAEEFAATPGRIFVVGFLQPRDPGEMLDALGADPNSMVIAVAPPSPRALDPELIVAAAAQRGIPALVAGSVTVALARAVAEAPDDALVLVCGSLYLVAAARAIQGR
jgi:dihydrofolate synthase / folylpolyglutamate synthase